MYRNISGITERIHFGFTMLRSNMCFQFSMLNIYHPYNVCHSKGRAIMRRAALVHLESGYCLILAALILSNCLTVDMIHVEWALRPWQIKKLILASPHCRLWFNWGWSWCITWYVLIWVVAGLDSHPAVYRWELVGLFFPQNPPVFSVQLLGHRRKVAVCKNTGQSVRPLRILVQRSFID